MMDRSGRRSVRWLVGLALAGLLGLQTVAEAKPMYVYVNDKGTSVMTDTLDHVPTQYRKTVKVFEMAEESETVDPNEPDAINNRVPDPITPTGVMSTVLDTMPTINMNQQKLMLLGGGLIIVASFVTLMFSRNMALKFAMKWLLMCAIVGTGYGWYFSSMGLGSFLGETESKENGQKPLVERIKDEAKMIEEIQKKKLMDIEKVLGEREISAEKRKP